VLFGGRTLLVEGIAEAILIPVIAKHYILKGKPEKYRLFRSAVFVPIDGIDFEPYANLLLATHNGVRITDRLVIITDGDSGATDEDRVAGGVARKTALDTLAKRLGAAETFEAIINTYSLEAEMVASGNDALLRQVYVSKDIHPRSGKKWDDAVALPEPADRAAALRTIFKDVRKGDFAHLLARRIEDGEAFVVPDYIKKAIEALVAE
jgi:putative ATP-dependent endonuclease of OLD family